jgi:hypothetical protein
MKRYIILLIIASFASCKPKMAAVQSDGVGVVAATDKNIADKYYENKLDFHTLYIKSSAKYSSSKESQNVTAEIKIENNKQILISVRFLGITMAKALITPKAVQYYEKINSSYYEGDFRSLSEWLGTELDYSKVQNLLVGEALDDLRKSGFTQTIVENLFRLQKNNEANLTKVFYIEPEKFILQKEEIQQTKENVNLAISYGDHKVFDQGIIPSRIEISATQPKGKTDINLTYNSISFNEELSFPYSVPSGYKKVIIK